MKLSVIFALAVAGSASAFQPSFKAPLTKPPSTSTTPDILRLGTNEVSAPLTVNEMVAIRNPFWGAFSVPKEPTIEAKIDYVVDRDYTVPLTLIVVGLWLSVFGPCA